MECLRVEFQGLASSRWSGVDNSHAMGLEGSPRYFLSGLLYKAQSSTVHQASPPRISLQATTLKGRGRGRRGGEGPDGVSGAGDDWGM